MKKSLLRSIIISVITVLALSSLVFAATSENGQVVKTKLDTKAMEVDHIKLNVPQTAAVIDSQTAIENAKKAFPDWAADAKEVSVEYHLVTNNTFKLFSDDALNKNSDLKNKKHMDKLPAYIVSFSGMTYYAHVPKDFKGEIPAHHEYNVIVDAKSGEPLMGFSNR